MQRWINLALTVCIAGLTAFVATQHFNKPKTVYVELGKVYNDFAMKKELQTKYDAMAQSRKSILDSLELQLKLMSAQLQDDEKNVPAFQLFEAKKQEYLTKKQQFDEDNSAVSAQYNEQITKQMTQYMEEFGKEKNYTYIYGADGSGVIMHADKELNVTDQAVQYLNQRYQGK